MVFHFKIANIRAKCRSCDICHSHECAQLKISKDTVWIAVEDEGCGFDPGAVPDPTEEANLEIPSGRGIMLMRAYMTEVEIMSPGNRIEMTFRRS